ncbi:uncharacterized protein RHO17_004206 [Thomomys bottae]
MSLNQKQNNKDQNVSTMPHQIQKEVVRGIQMSINNIATQITNVNKYAEGVLGNLCKEVDETSSRLMALQENVIQMATDMKYQDTNQKDCMDSTQYNRHSQNITVQTEKADFLKPSFARLCKTQDVSIQTMPTYSDNSQAVANHRENVYLCETCKRKFRPEIRENQGKSKQEYQHLDDTNVTKNMPQVKGEIPLNHTQATCGNFVYSHVKPPKENPSVSTNQLTEISKILTKTIGTVLTTPPLMKRNNSGTIENSNYIRYGGGTYEVQPQLQIHPEIVLVGCTAPPSPTPLTPKSLPRLRTPVVACPFIYTSHQVISPALSFSTEVPSECTETTSPTDLEDISPKTSSYIVSKPFEYKRRLPDQIKKDQEVQFSSVSVSSVISDTDEIMDTCSDLTSSTSLYTWSLKTSVTPNSRSSCEQPPKMSVIPNSRSSYVQPPKTSVIPNSKSRCVPPPKTSVIPNSRSSFVQTPRCLVVSTPKSPHPMTHACQNPPLTKSIIVPKPSHPIQQPAKSSVPRRSCLCSHTTKSPIPSSRAPPSQSQKISIIPPRSSNVRATRASEFSGRSTIAQSAGHLRAQPPNMKSSTSSNLESISSTLQKSSTITSRHPTSGPQFSSASIQSAIKQCGSVSPIFARAKNTLMDIIRKSIQLNRNEDPPEEDEQGEISRNEGRKPPKSS